MVYQRVHKPAFWQPPSQAKSAQPVPRPVASPAQQNLQGLGAPEGIENEAKDDDWPQRTEQAAQPGHSFANILVRPTVQQTSAQAQPAVAADENRTGMPVPLRAGLEQLSGLDLSEVRVHYNSDKPAQLNALAYTQGHEIEVGPGQERHLPHEAWHVVQQAQGRVKATMQMKDGVPVNDDAGLEREADAMGTKAAELGQHPILSRLREGRAYTQQLRRRGNAGRAMQGVPQAKSAQPSGSTFAAQAKSAESSPDNGAPRATFGHNFVQVPVYSPAEHGSAQGMQEQRCQAIRSTDTDRRLQADGQVDLSRRLQRAVDMRSPQATSAVQEPNRTGLPDQLIIGNETLAGGSADDGNVHYDSFRLAQFSEPAGAQGRESHGTPGQERFPSFEDMRSEAEDLHSSELGFDHDTKDLPADTRKKLAHRWVQQQAKLNDLDPHRLKKTLDKAKDYFALSDIQVQSGGEKSLRIGYFASPGDWKELFFNKAVGNKVSDLGLGYGFGPFHWLKSFVSGNAASPTYGPLTGRGMGTFMYIHGLTNNNIPKGSETNADRLAKLNPTYDALRLRRTSDNPRATTYYVAGHLLSEKLGGTGADWHNLAPLTQHTNLNSDFGHKKQVEIPVQQLLQAPANNTVAYRVQATYGRWPWQQPKYFSQLLVLQPLSVKPLEQLRDAEQHIPTGFKCEWWVEWGDGSIIPHSLYIQQEGGGLREPYWVKLSGAPRPVDLNNKFDFWSFVRQAFMLLLGRALAAVFPMLVPLLANTPYLGVLANKHLLRGLVLTVLTDYLGRAANLAPGTSQYGIGPKISARSAQIGLATSFASLVASSYFGVSDLPNFDTFLAYAVGDISRVAIDSEFDIGAAVQAVKTAFSGPGLWTWLTNPSVFGLVQYVWFNFLSPQSSL